MTVTGDCDNVYLSGGQYTPVPGPPQWIQAYPRLLEKSAVIAHTPMVTNRSAHPYAYSPEGRPDDSACNNPESWQIWYSFDRKALDDALLDSDIVDAGIKSYAYAHNDFPDKLPDGSDHPHLYNPVDVIRGIRDNYRTASPHPHVAIRATLPDELPTLLNGGTLLYFAIRVNFSEIDTTSPPTANVPYYGIWSPIQEFRIRCGTSSTLPHGDCGWRLGL